jgi:hypothetical protein
VYEKNGIDPPEGEALRIRTGPVKQEGYVQKGKYVEPMSLDEKARMSEGARLRAKAAASEERINKSGRGKYNDVSKNQDEEGLKRFKESAITFEELLKGKK